MDVIDNNILRYKRNKKGKLVISLSNGIKKFYEDNEINELQILGKIENQYLDSRQDLLNDSLKRTYKIDILIIASRILFIIFISLCLLLVSIPIINFCKMGSLLMSNSLLKVYVSLLLPLFPSYILSNYLDTKADSLMEIVINDTKYVDKCDLVIDNEDELNDSKTLNIIKDINPKLFKIVEKNRYELIPPININSVRNITYEELLDVLEKIDSFEDENEGKIVTKIINFKNK